MKSSKNDTQSLETSAQHMNIQKIIMKTQLLIDVSSEQTPTDTQLISSTIEPEKFKILTKEEKHLIERKIQTDMN